MPEIPTDLLTGAQVAELLGVPRATLAGWRHRNRGPRSFRLGRTVRYRRADVEAWVEAEFERTARGVPVDRGAES